MPEPVVTRAEYQINTAVTANDQDFVTLDALAGGGFVLGWRSNDGDPLDRDTRYSIRDASGDALSTSTDDESLAIDAFTMENSTDVAGLIDGRMVHVWQEEVGVGEIDIHAEVRNASGSALGSGFLLSTVTGAATNDQSLPRVIGLDDGNFLAAWVDTAPALDVIVAKVFDLAGAEIASQTISATAIDTGDRPMLTRLSGGNVVVSWINDLGPTDQQMFAIVAPDGTLVRGETDFNPSDTTEESLSGGDVAALADGNFVVVVRRASETNDIRGRLFDADGEDIGTLLHISTGAGNHAAVTALHDGRFMVVYDRNGDIFGQMMLANGLKDGVEFTVANAAGTQAEPDITTLADGRIVVSWHSTQNGTRDIYSEIYDPREAGLSGSASALADDWAGTAFVDNVYFGKGNDSFDGLASNDTLFGEDGNDALSGGEGDDSLNGGTGIDTLLGGIGNDTYYVDSTADTADETGGSGIDSVRSTATYTLAADIEKLYLDGTATVSGTGNALVNYMYGNAGNNSLDGREGVDRLYGGAGNDYYYVDSSGDLVVETIAGTAGGSDIVYSTVNHTLSENVETLDLNGTGNINATGNALDNNYIEGNSGNNFINGMAGSDFLYGMAGLDQFLFSTALGPTNVDVLSDFNPAEDFLRLDDAIFTTVSVGYLAVSAFRFGAAAADADDRIIYDSTTGFVYYDADGTGAVAQVQFAELPLGLALTNADIYVY
ncbi:MAG: calcium-binding protein [Aestuariivirga sp.]